MPTIGSTSKPAYVYDSGTDTWIPIGPGEHTHDYAASAHNHDSAYIAKTLTTTTGDIIYASAANTPARLGIGSTDQVLKVSGGVPTWAAPSSGAYVLVKARTTFTAVADTGTTFDNVFTSTYKNYIVIVDNLVSSTTGNQLRWRHRYGSATSQTAYYGAQIQLNVLATFYNIAGNNVAYAELGEIYNADYSLHNILVSGANNSSYYMPISSTGFSSAKNGPLISGWQATTARDYHGFQLSVASGTMTGTVAIYGVVAS